MKYIDGTKFNFEMIRLNEFFIIIPKTFVFY